MDQHCINIKNTHANLTVRSTTLHNRRYLKVTAELMFLTTKSNDDEEFDGSQATLEDTTQVL